LAVSESQRLALHKAARAALGEKEGDTLMELSPPSNTDIATRQDVERAEERLGARIDATRQELTNAEERLGARIDATRQELTNAEERLGARIDATRQELTNAEERLNARIDATRQELTNAEERLNARIDAAVGASAATLTRAMHASELRTMGVIVLAFLGTNLLG
jgi:chromosome segregation ATPase